MKIYESNYEVFFNIETLSCFGNDKILFFQNKLSEHENITIEKGENKRFPEIEITDNKEFKIYMFLHASDFFPESQTHFEVDFGEKLENDASTFEKESLNRFLSKLTNSDKDKNRLKNNFKFKILWYKHEPRSCTVYSKLEPILKKIAKNKELSMNNEGLRDELIQIFNIHDIEERSKKRNDLISKFLEGEDDIEDVRLTCKEFEI